MSTLEDYINPKVNTGKLVISAVIRYQLRGEMCYGRITATHIESLGAVRVEVLAYEHYKACEYVYLPDILDILPERIKPEDIKQGSIIRYQLASHDLPVHPERMWRGRVLLAYDNDWDIHVYKVSILVSGYEGDTERVMLEQIKIIEI